MDRYSHFVFLIFAVISFLLARYDFALANFVSALGFALCEYRYHIIVRFKLLHHWERRMKRVGNIIGYLGIVILFVIIAMKYLK